MSVRRTTRTHGPASSGLNPPEAATRSEKLCWKALDASALLLTSHGFRGKLRSIDPPPAAIVLREGEPTPLAFCVGAIPWPTIRFRDPILLVLSGRVLSGGIRERTRRVNRAARSLCRNG